MPRWLRTRVPRPAEPATTLSRAKGLALLPLIACFTLGALALLRMPALPDWRWCLPALIPLLLRWRGRAYAAALLLGAVLAAWQVQAVLAQRWPVARINEVIEARGVIISLPQGRADTLGDAATTRTWRFLFAPQNPALPSRIRVSWYRSQARLRGGDCWTFRLRLRPPHGSLNPGGFDYEGWLFRQGIGATASVRSATPCGVAAGYRLLRLRQAIADRIGVWLPDHPGAPLVSVLAIGDTSALDQDDWQDFRLTGTVHLIAISGFHVAVVAGVAFFLLRWLWSLSAWLCLRLPAQRAGLIGSALFALAYALLAGFQPPVERAVLMLLFLLAAGWFGGFAQPARALAAAWAIIVASNPLALLAPGLWLSFGAVAAITYSTAGRLGRQPVWREVLRVQLMLSIVLAPLTLYFFQGTSLLGPVANLIAVPVAGVLTPLVLAALLLAAALPSLGIPMLGLVASMLDRSAHGLAWLAAQLPQAWIATSPAPAVLAVALLGALLLFVPRGVPLRALGALCLAALLLPAAAGPQQDFELSALDVGQGTAVVVRTARHTLLFDAGPAFPGGFDAGRAVVVPYLLAIGVHRLDRLIVSHRDLDHRGGVPAVRALIEVDDEIGALVPEACRAGQSWQWDGVDFEILNGPAPGLSENDGGCVLRIVSAHLSALLPADIEAKGETALLAASAGALHADILLAPHHGSRTSSSPAFIDAVQPGIVIYSAGWHHRFHHPAPDVVTRYATRVPGVRQYATGDSGAVIVRETANGPEVSEWRADGARLWTTPADFFWEPLTP